MKRKTDKSRLNIEDVSDGQLLTLRVKAAAWFDTELVKLVDRALQGDDEARQKVAPWVPQRH